MWSDFLKLINYVFFNKCQKYIIFNTTNTYYKIKIDNKYLETTSAIRENLALKITKDDIIWLSQIHYGVAYSTYDMLLKSREYDFLKQHGILFTIVHQTQIISWEEKRVTDIYHRNRKKSKEYYDQ